ncbi:MAG TPA: YqiA/YcfP family alpha/beta fold hydrolase [Burkholderiales bacterium]|nr:YqiA/YcfP family alpha/beta fold hydrolase [Burkholderiales bacterium]
MIVYIHGFNSSPQSFKARLLRERLAALGRAEEFAAPALPASPRAASALLCEIVSGHQDAALIGSSLGGYYATWLAERLALRAVLVNPAVRPYELLVGAVGRQKNYHTGEDYDFTAQHLDELRALEVEAITPERYLLLVGTADEVLDYRTAAARYRGCRQIVVAGGNHGLDNFSDHLDVTLDFCGATALRARV